MAAQNVCRYNKFGYCKYNQQCKLKHEKEICESNTCKVSQCKKIHPNHVDIEMYMEIMMNWISVMKY